MTPSVGAVGRRWETARARSSVSPPGESAERRRQLPAVQVDVSTRSVVR
jgi:hypothetical protein